MALRAEQAQIVEIVRATLSNGLFVVNLVPFEQVAAQVASVPLACLERVAGLYVQYVPWAHEEPLHELVAQHAGRFSKVVELDASFLGALAESQELFVVVWYSLNANALGALGFDEDASTLAVGLPHRPV